MTALSDGTRLSELTALQQSSRTNVVTLDIPTFKRYVEDAPRSYSLFAMFSADAKLCQPCATVKKSIQQVAQDYYALPKSKAAKQPIFFIEVRLTTSDQEFLMLYEIRHVPVVYRFPPGSSKAFPKALSDKSHDFYPLQQVGIGVNTLKEFINARTRSKMPMPRTNYQIPFVETVRMFMPLIIILVVAFASIAIFTGAYKNPMLWFGLVCLVYIFSVGGGHYSWIHKSPLAVVDKNGYTQYIASGSRSQYVAEGFFVSATCVSISALVILIQELPSVLPHKGGQTVVGSVLVFLTFFAIYTLLVLYTVVRRFHFLCFKRKQLLLFETKLTSATLQTILLLRVCYFVNENRKCSSTCNTARCDAFEC